MQAIERINLPKPDTHCFDDDTKSDVWSYSRELVISTVLAHIDKLEAEVERLRKDAEQMLVTLTSIRDANPRDWEELACEATEFERWAKLCANYSITKSAGAAKKGTP